MNDAPDSSPFSDDEGVPFRVFEPPDEEPGPTRPPTVSEWWLAYGQPVLRRAQFLVDSIEDCAEEKIEARFALAQKLVSAVLDLQSEQVVDWEG